MIFKNESSQCQKKNKNKVESVMYTSEVRRNVCKTWSVTTEEAFWAGRKVESALDIRAVDDALEDSDSYHQVRYHSNQKVIK